MTIEWKNDLYVHLTYPNYSFSGKVNDITYQTSFYECDNNQYYPDDFHYDLDPGPIYKHGASPIKMTLNFSTLGPIVAQ